MSDLEFKKIIALLRITVPYTGMILSTREDAGMRRDSFSLGISQVSAGSRTNPGGYSQEDAGAQFSLGDHRTLDEVIHDIASMGYVPSFCTGCYRLGRVGRDFMDLAKPGLIKRFCLPNALTTFKEYLVHYSTPETREIGEKVIESMLQEVPDAQTRAKTEEYLQKIVDGGKDLYF